MKNRVERAPGAHPKHETLQPAPSMIETKVPNDAAPPQFERLAATIAVPAQDMKAQLGRFRVLRPHAEGGLGRVFVAFDGEVGREVALKEMKSECANDFDSRDRFTREAEITGNLEHPGVVPVYGQGSYPDGRPYYAMRFIRGISLREAIEAYHREGPDTRIEDGAVSYTFDLRRLLRRLSDVCQTMQYAHSRGVLHRDLKPGNIMLGPYGETLVVDWGLAKASGEASVDLAADLENSISRASLPEIPVMLQSSESQPTLLGSAVGTPAFMSPEQAQGRVDLLGPTSDVFSLGAILFQIITGLLPYRGATGIETLHLAKSAQYPRPRTLNPKIPRALEAICLKAMHPVMTQRYSSAAHLARDLDCYLADEPISAHQASLTEKAARWIRHHKMAAVAGTISLLVLLAAAVTIAAISVSYGNSLKKTNDQLTVAKNEAVEQRDAAEKAQAEAQRLEGESSDRLQFIFNSLRNKPKATGAEILKEATDEFRRRALEAAKQPASEGPQAPP